MKRQQQDKANLSVALFILGKCSLVENVLTNVIKTEFAFSADRDSRV